MMKRITRGAQRKAARAFASKLKSHPELVPMRAKNGNWQPTIEAAPTASKRHVTRAEAKFAQLAKRVGIACEYEPFTFGLGLRASGSVRGFQPDFWLPELGIVVELCATAQAKNQKIRLISRGWPDLPVLVLSDDQVKSLCARRALTRWQFISWCVELLAEQDVRVRAEGDDPKGYRGRSTARKVRRPAQNAKAETAKATPSSSSRRRRRRRRTASAAA
jgi:hypothetical protein